MAPEIPVKRQYDTCKLYEGRRTQCAKTIAEDQRDLMEKLRLNPHLYKQKCLPTVDPCIEVKKLRCNEKFVDPCLTSLRIEKKKG